MPRRATLRKKNLEDFVKKKKKANVPLFLRVEESDIDSSDTNSSDEREKQPTKNAIQNLNEFEFTSDAYTDIINISDNIYWALDISKYNADKDASNDNNISTALERVIPDLFDRILNNNDVLTKLLTTDSELSQVMCLWMLMFPFHKEQCVKINNAIFSGTFNINYKFNIIWSIYAKANIKINKKTSGNYCDRSMSSNYSNNFNIPSLKNQIQEMKDFKLF